MINVSKEVTKIRNKITKLQEHIKTIQNNCPHNNVESKYGADTGNYDPSEDIYWIDYTCKDCNKMWTEYK